ncbi:hypothetical protein [Pseudomonas putida]|uniref:hypothetical protein n=1 Tax=Pseudomonas putida TaxID=303 RepID=UPI00114CE46B|nr:hypothetical protein [Pseudomonas putida]
MSLERAQAKSGFIKLYEIVWNILRIGAVFALCILASCAGLFVYVVVREGPRPIVPIYPTVCGVVSGVAYEFPSAYVPFWPIYEDEGAGADNISKREKGCDSKLASLSLALNWPELTPGKYFSEKFSGIVVTLEPWSAGERGLRQTLDFYLEEASAKQREEKVFDRLLGLNKVEGVDVVFPDAPRMIFWFERNGSLKQIGRCSWSKYRSKYHRCNFRYLLEDGKGIVKIDFGWDELNKWNEIALQSRNFLRSSEK